MHFQSVIMATAFSVAMLASPLLAAEELATDASFPAPGHVYEINFGDRQFRVKFDTDGKTMTYTRPDGSGDTVQYTAIEIRPRVFMVYWAELKSGNRVVHVEDFERGVVFGNTATTNGTFIHSKGTLKRVE